MRVMQQKQTAKVLWRLLEIKSKLQGHMTLKELKDATYNIR